MKLFQNYCRIALVLVSLISIVISSGGTVFASHGSEKHESLHDSYNVVSGASENISMDGSEDSDSIEDVVQSTHEEVASSSEIAESSDSDLEASSTETVDESYSYSTHTGTGNDHHYNDDGHGHERGRKQNDDNENQDCSNATSTVDGGSSNGDDGITATSTTPTMATSTATSTVTGGSTNDGDGVVTTSTPPVVASTTSSEVSSNPPATTPGPIVTVPGGGSTTFAASSPVVTVGGGGSSPAPQPIPIVTAGVQDCNYLLEYIRFGAQNNPFEVQKLQLFLRSFEGFQNLQITGFYDSATFEAVKVFQVRYKADVLDPWGLTEPTGYVYITTKKKINEIYCSKPFSLTDAQVDEIDNARALLERLRNEGGSPEQVQGFEGGLGGIPSSTEENFGALPSNESGTQFVDVQLPSSTLAIATTATTTATSSLAERLRTLAGVFLVLPWGWILAILLIFLLLGIVLSSSYKKREVVTLSSLERDESSGSDPIIGSV